MKPSRPGRSARSFLVALSAAAVLLAGACGSPAASAPGGPAAAAPAMAVVPPGTTAGVQLRWLMAAMARLPLSGAQVRAHFDTAFLAQVSPAVLNQALQAVASLRLLSIRTSELSTVVADVTIGGTGPPAQVFLAVDRQGLINWLRISPPPAAPPATWAGVDAAVESAAPQVRLLVADVTGSSCQPVHSLDPGTAAPLAAASKLYVLDALGQAVAAGTVGWNQLLTVTAPDKSLPPGELQDAPDGTRVSVLDTAAAMTSLSDNTATDMLIHLLGRPAVQAALTRTGMADPALDRPFLTTREIFTLKLRHWPALAGRYLAAGPAGRRALLASTVDRAPLPAVAAAADWTAPRAVASLEYFASASDLCRLYASLAALARRPGLAPIGQLLSLNDDGLQLDPAQWRTTWFKGGSEPGVLTLAFMATTRTGHSYVVTVLAEDPTQPINQATAIPVILSAVNAAFTLAARAGQDAVDTAAHGTRSSTQPPEPNPASALTRPPGRITRHKPASHRAHATPQETRCPVSPMPALADSATRPAGDTREHHDHRICTASRNSSATAAPKKLICVRPRASLRQLPTAPSRARVTVTRRLCTIAGFYKYAVEEELLEHSPAAHVRRPRLDYESHATALDRNELGAMLVAAGLGPPTEHTLIFLARAERAAGLGGYRRRHLAAGPGRRAPDADHHPQGRQAGDRPAGAADRPGDRPGHRRTNGRAGFLAADGRRLDRHGAGRTVRKLARGAGITKAVTPHTLRHAFITAAFGGRGAVARHARGSLTC